MALLKDYLIAHYKMNDNTATAVVVDSSGNGHTGEYQLNNIAQNTNTSDVAGKILRALDFVGGANGEHIEIDDDDDFSPGDGTEGSGTPLSISAWVNMHSATSFVIASKGVVATNLEWYFRLTSSKLRMLFYDKDISKYIGQSFDTVLTGYVDKWIHLVGTYNGGSSDSAIKLYLNVIQVDDNAFGSGGFVATENLNGSIWIGRNENDYANGLIDNVMFFNKELTPLEVKYLYNGGAGTENIPSGIQLSRTGQRFSSFPEN